MYVCVCNRVTDSDIRNAVDDGISNIRQLSQSTGCSTSCGCCKEMATEILQQAVEDRRNTREIIPILQMA